VKLPKIIFVPLSSQRFTTLGDWWQDCDGTYTIAVTEMRDWRYQFLVLMHELTEWSICCATGVSAKIADEFDAAWEEDIKSGLVSVSVEAGFDKACPYRQGHVWGARMERLFCYLLKANWKDYCRECDELLLQYNS
jgi:hypothetical protein